MTVSFDRVGNEQHVGEVAAIPVHRVFFEVAGVDDHGAAGDLDAGQAAGRVGARRLFRPQIHGQFVGGVLHRGLEQARVGRRRGPDAEAHGVEHAVVAGAVGDVELVRTRAAGDSRTHRYCLPSFSDPHESDRRESAARRSFPNPDREPAKW